MKKYRIFKSLFNDIEPFLDALAQKFYGLEKAKGSSYSFGKQKNKLSFHFVTYLGNINPWQARETLSELEKVGFNLIKVPIQQGRFELAMPLLQGKINQLENEAKLYNLERNLVVIRKDIPFVKTLSSAAEYKEMKTRFFERELLPFLKKIGFNSSDLVSFAFFVPKAEPEKLARFTLLKSYKKAGFLAYMSAILLFGFLLALVGTKMVYGGSNILGMILFTITLILFLLQFICSVLHLSERGRG